MIPKNEFKLLGYINHFWDGSDEENEYNTMEAATVLWDFMEKHNITEDDLLSLDDKVQHNIVTVTDKSDWTNSGFVGMLIEDINNDRSCLDDFKKDQTILLDFSSDGYSAWDYLRHKLNNTNPTTVEERNLYNAIKVVVHN